tara:strand:+ start:136 stop:336 length:201 start_codon:yes stop_codon:yes gene_type:complete
MPQGKGTYGTKRGRPKTKSAKGGRKVSWTWRGKTYSGTLIPSKEDKDNRYARTENGKIKTLPKKKK